MENIVFNNGALREYDIIAPSHEEEDRKESGYVVEIKDGWPIILWIYKEEQERIKWPYEKWVVVSRAVGEFENIEDTFKNQ